MPHAKLAGSQRLSLVERAFELARTGYFANAADVGRQLKQEGYIKALVDEHLRGRSIRSKIKNLCREAKRKR
jgi:hypothetical protein